MKGSPISIDSIGRRAVSRLGVAPASQGHFGEVFARSAAAAWLAETTGTITIARPLSAVDFASIGSVVAQIEKLVAGLADGDADA